MAPLTLKLLPESFAIHRLHPESQLPPEVFSASFYSVTRSEFELSLVLPERVNIDSTQSEKGWGCFMIEGPLDFALTGILSSIATVLSEAQISIFAVSTFDTDYILVKQAKIEEAKEVLIENRFRVLGS